MSLFSEERQPWINTVPLPMLGMWVYEGTLAVHISIYDFPEYLP